MRSNSPSWVTAGSVSSRRSSGICSDIRRPRSPNDCAERLVLDGVPAEPDAEPEPSLGQQVDLGGLLGDERRLALGQDDHAGDQLERGARGEVAEQHERLVERRVHVVRAVPRRVRLGIGAEHVVVGEQVGEPELLDRRSRTAARRRPPAPISVCGNTTPICIAPF